MISKDAENMTFLILWRGTSERRILGIIGWKKEMGGNGRKWEEMKQGRSRRKLLSREKNTGIPNSPQSDDKTL